MLLAGERTVYSCQIWTGWGISGSILEPAVLPLSTYIYLTSQAIVPVPFSLALLRIPRLQLPLHDNGILPGRGHGDTQLPDGLCVHRGGLPVLSGGDSAGSGRDTQAGVHTQRCQTRQYAD